MDALTLLRRAEHVLFAVLLVVGVAQSPGPATVATAIGVGGWYAAGMVLARKLPSRALGTVWLCGLLLGWVGLLALDTSFAWLSFVLFLLFLQMLPPRWGIPAVGAMTLLSAWATHAVIGPVLGAAVAIVITSVYRSLRIESEAKAKLAERERLSREIHDTVAQNLSSIILLLRAGDTEQAETVARRSLEDTRRLVRALSPEQLEAGSLPEALGRLVAEARHFGLDARFTLDGQPQTLPTPVSVALLRVSQGALANVKAHARAGQAAVTLAFQPGSVRLDIADDGVGFEPDRAGGQGLRVMRSRLAEVGGALIVESAPGEGCAISATIPLAAAVGAA